MAKYRLKKDELLLREWKDRVQLNTTWRRAIASKYYGLKYDTWRKVDTQQFVREDSLEEIYKHAPESYKQQFPHFANFLAHFFEDETVVADESIDNTPAEPITLHQYLLQQPDTPIYALPPSLASFRYSRFVRKNRPVTISWHGTSIDEAFLSWHEEQGLTELYFLDPIGIDRSFVPPKTETYLCTFRNAQGKTLEKPIRISVISSWHIALIALSILATCVWYFLPTIQRYV